MLIIKKLNSGNKKMNNYNTNIKSKAKITKDIRHNNIAKQTRMEKRNEALWREIEKKQKLVKKIEAQSVSAEKRLKEILKEQSRLSELREKGELVADLVEHGLSGTLFKEVKQIEKSLNQNKLNLDDIKLEIKSIPCHDLNHNEFSNFKTQIDIVTGYILAAIVIHKLIKEGRSVDKKTVKKTIPEKKINKDKNINNKTKEKLNVQNKELNTHDKIKRKIKKIQKEKERKNKSLNNIIRGR